MHPITNRVLQTERMVLRQMEMDDVDDLMGIWRGRSRSGARRSASTRFAKEAWRRSLILRSRELSEFELRVAGYQFPDIEIDANWLVVESRVALADERTWEFRDQAATSGAPSPRASVAAEP